MSDRGSNSGRRVGGYSSSPLSDDSHALSQMQSLKSRPPWAASAASSYVRSGSYRDINLRSAHVYVEEVAMQDWPAHILQLAEALAGPGGGPAPAVLQPNPTLTDDPLRESAVTLAGQVSNYRLKSESDWMELNRRVLSVLEHDHLIKSQDRRFDAQVGPTSDTNLFLSTPTPDLAFGLPTSLDEDADEPLSRSLLTQWYNLRGVQAFPSPGRPDMAFPCLIYEAEPDTGNLVAPENQASYGAAKALSMIQSLRNRYHELGGSRMSERLPVIVICSRGPIYEVLVAFDLHANEIPPKTTDPASAKSTAKAGVHLVEIWTGSVHRPEVMYLFQLLLNRVLSWFLATFRPTIINMINTVKASVS
ncbi:hypothetical protein BCV69DRAFT_60197 [Microstroma glucosiphilum]|uniref:Uncharacterized protein n=1 Tax=Pseudomicrostroma glucosiphilum TaxID=1684307 RepID=A0A316TZS6_9BASI|nr:hypothetical protein BCV69DRAFT_60197 [Pseudomicrostroma glucosiphilum]PWN18699.1 hypothetical protein BCV69DRAFT_60197 [Pseudomicrostroma glucosiphilum]